MKPLLIITLSFLDYLPILLITLVLFRHKINIRSSLFISFIAAVLIYTVRFQYGYEALGGPIMTIMTLILFLRFIVKIPFVSASIMSLTGYFLAGIVSSIDMLIILKLSSMNIEDFKTDYSLLAINVISESAFNLIIASIIYKKRLGFSFLSSYSTLKLKQNLGFFIFIILSILLVSFFLHFVKKHYFDVFSVVLLFAIVLSLSFYLSYRKEILD
jgi:hypothetical protein